MKDLLDYLREELKKRRVELEESEERIEKLENQLENLKKESREALFLRKQYNKVEITESFKDDLKSRVPREIRSEIRKTTKKKKEMVENIWGGLPENPTKK